MDKTRVIFSTAL